MNPPKSETDSEPSCLRGLRVCFVAGTLGQGGAERQLYYMLRTLQAKGAEPVVLTLGSAEHWEQRIREAGIEVRNLGGTSSRFGRLIELLREVRRLKPHVLQSQHFYTNIYVACIGRVMRVPTIAAVRNDGLSEVHDAYRWFRSLGLTLASGVAANSQRAIDNLVGEGFDSKGFFLLPNVIDTERFAMRSFSGGPDSTLTCLGVGRLVKQKRFDLFLEVVSRLAQRTTRRLHAVIAGDGPDRGSLLEHARRLQRPNLTVSFVGAVPDPRDLYRTATLLLLTSDWEGTPNVVMEAMACGLPVVATEVGGVGELIRHGETGFVFPSGQVDVAVGLVDRLATDDTVRRRIADQARSSIEATRSLRALPTVLAELYSWITRGRRRPWLASGTAPVDVRRQPA